MFRELYANFTKAIGLENRQHCNVPAGNYSARYPVYIASGEVPFWTGRFRSTFALNRIANDKKVFCGQNLVNLVEVPH